MGKETLSFEEAENVVKMWSKSTKPSEGVDIDSLASSLGISREEVIALHAKANGVSQKHVPERKFVDRSGILSAAIAGGIVALVAVIVIGVRLLSGGETPTESIATGPVPTNIAQPAPMTPAAAPAAPAVQQSII